MVKSSNNIFKISWVKVHVGIQETEDADALAKRVALNPREAISYCIEKTVSNLKKTLKELTIKQWQFEGIYGEGRQTQSYFSTLDRHRLVS